MPIRDYDDPQFKKFRQDVRNRDGRKCRWPNCGKTKKLQVHHIMPWAGHPHLRYNVANGITLCKDHHKFVTGKELEFAKFLFKIIANEF